MPALEYVLPSFIRPVVSGAKPHSIRIWRKRPFRKGDTLMHYTAMQSKACRKIRPDTICTAAVPIVINTRERTVKLEAGSSYYRTGLLSKTSIEVLATLDGFATIAEFWEYFGQASSHQGNPEIFSGQLVEWDPFAPVVDATPENGESAAARSGRVYSRPRAPISPVRSRPAAAGQRKPRGQCRKAPAAASSPREVK